MWQHTLVLMWPGRWVGKSHSHSVHAVNDESCCYMIKWSENDFLLHWERNQFGTHRKNCWIARICEISKLLYRKYIIISSSITQQVLKIEFFIFFFPVKVADCVHAKCFLHQSWRFLSLLLKRHLLFMTKGLLCFVHNENKCDLSLMFPECRRFQLFAFCLLSWEVVSFISGAYDALALLCLSWWNRVKQVISHVLLGLCVCCSGFPECNACSDLNPQNKESSGIDISEYRLDWGRDLDSLELVYSGTETFFQISNLEASTDYCCRLQVGHDVFNVNYFLLGPWDVCSNILILG